MSNKLIIVSNRLPVQVSQTTDGISLVKSDGGLVSSMKSYLQKTAGTPGLSFESASWIGGLDINEKKYQKNKFNEQLIDADFNLIPVFISRSVREKYYNGFCNDMIWPLFHYFPSYARFKDDNYDCYKKSNQIFADQIAATYTTGDTIWIHDYHLMLVPSMLREKLPNAKIGFFLHIPFPGFEIYRMLPALWRRELLDGILGADLIGFHTNSYAQHFLNSVKQLLGYEVTPERVQTKDRSVNVDAFPVSIDYQKFSDVIGIPEIFEERNRIRRKLGECKLVISVDRLDYTKGIMNRLEGFELFLNQHPELKGHVTLMMNIIPSRDVISKYAELKQAIDGFVGKINSRYGNLDWTPIIYQYRQLDFCALAGLYIAADVALITPVRDGMNLVAKEFVASRSDRRGVLILSETAGAATELGEALIINPTDRCEVSDALHKALTMPVSEQIIRNEFMQRRLKNYDVIRWAEGFQKKLSEAHEEQQRFKIKMLSPARIERIKNQYNGATKRLIVLDYDGTLTGIVRHPQLAAPSQQIKQLLTDLSDDPCNRVVIVSGRTKDELENWFGDINIELVAEHGAFWMKQPGVWTESVLMVSDWKEQIIAIMNMFSERCPGSFAEEKECSVGWHYRACEKELGFVRSRELHERLMDLSAHSGFQVIQGNQIIEVRARDINKGVATLKLLEEASYDFILAAGDDRTDEDIFSVLPEEAISIRIGVSFTKAKYNVAQQQEFPVLLDALANKATTVND